MNLSWQNVSLGKIAKVIGGYAFKSTDFVGSGIPVIKIKNIEDKNVSLSNLDFLPSSFDSLSEKYKIRFGDILISLTGSHITMPNSAVGRVARSRHNFTLLLNQRVGKIQVDDKLADKTFVYYSMIDAKFREQIGLLSRGAANQANISGGDVESVEISCPPLPTQKKIAGVLSAYDDLIEANLKRIKLLEEMAQITYEEWFERLRFPNHETTPINPETSLPQGWKIGSLSSIITKLESGTRPKGGIDRNQTLGVPSVGAENVIGIGRYNYGAEKLVSEEFFLKMRRGKISQKDILIYKDGAYIGKTSMFQDGFPYKVCAVNEHVFLINSANEFWQNFTYFTLSKKEYYLKMQGLNSGAAQPGINQEKLKGLDLLLPSDEIISLFNERIEPIVKVIFTSATQNRLLREARDLLLPRLMTGLIDIDDYLSRNSSAAVAA